MLKYNQKVQWVLQKLKRFIKQIISKLNICKIARISSKIFILFLKNFLIVIIIVKKWDIY